VNRSKWEVIRGSREKNLEEAKSKAKVAWGTKKKGGERGRGEK